MLLHHAEEGDAEDIAGDSFAEADGEGVIEERGRDTRLQPHTRSIKFSSTAPESA